MEHEVDGEIPVSVLLRVFGTGITDEIYYSITKKWNKKQKRYQVKLNHKWDKVYKVRNRFHVREIYNAILVERYTWVKSLGNYTKSEQLVLCKKNNKFESVPVAQGKRDYLMEGIAFDKDMAYAYSKDYEDVLNESV